MAGTNDAHSTPLPAQPAQHRWQRRLLWVGGLIALAAVVYFMIPWVWTALTTVSTDDAYVNSHVTFVAPRVKGQVVRVLVDDNYRVRKGDILVQLDKQPYHVEVDRKKAALDIAQSKLVQARASVKATATKARALRYQMVNAVQQVRSQIQGLQTDVASLNKFQAAMDDARREYIRVERLLDNGGAASREEFDQRRANWLEAEASVRMASENIRKTRAALSIPLEPPGGKGLGYVPPGLEQNHPTVLAALSEVVTLGAELGLELPPDVDSPELLLKRFHVEQPEEYEKIIRQLVENAPAIKVAVADVEQAKADLAQANLDLLYTDVVAEIDGVVTGRNVNPGNNVQPGQSLMAVRSLTEIWIDANFKETQLADLRIGQRVRCEVDMYGSRREYEGRITGFTMGTGETLALLPPQNATGNFVKIVQRLPVRVELTNYDPERQPLFVGLSVTPYIYYKEPPTGDHAGEFLQPLRLLPQGPTAPNP